MTGCCKADAEPQNWLTYSGSYKGWRYSKLDQINRAEREGPQAGLGLPDARDASRRDHTAGGGWRDVSERAALERGRARCGHGPSVLALQAQSAREDQRLLRAGQPRRGVLGDRVFVGTVDAHLVALNAKTGAVLWDTEVADYRTGYSITVAPLIVKDMVVTGIAGGEYGIRGFLDAYDAEDRQAALALLDHSGPGREGQRNLARRRLEARRRAYLGDRLLRSGAEPHHLGHGQSLARLEWRRAQGRQPVLRFAPSRSMPTPAS